MSKSPLKQPQMTQVQTGITDQYTIMYVIVVKLQFRQERRPREDLVQARSSWKRLIYFTVCKQILLQF